MRLFPTDESYFDELEALASHLTVATESLERLFQQPERPVELHHRIRQAEHDADELTHEITSRVDKSLVTPLDREDLYALARGVDRVVDQIEDAAKYAAAFEISRSDAGAREQAGVLRRASLLVSVAVAEMRHSKSDRSLFEQVRGLSEEAASVYEGAMTRLFAGQPDPIEVIKWKEIYDKLDTSMHGFQEVADVLEGIAIKSN